MRLFACLALPLVLLGSCATGPRYTPATSDTAWLYGKVVNPLTWTTGSEIHTSVISVDGVTSGREVEVDAGKHAVELMGVGPGNFTVFGTMRLTVAKDEYYYFRCRRSSTGYRFDCEVEGENGMRGIASAPASSRR